MLVHPDYQGQGMPEDKNNVPFYLKHGFSVMENGVASQLCILVNTRAFVLCKTFTVVL